MVYEKQMGKWTFLGSFMFEGYGKTPSHVTKVLLAYANDFPVTKLIFSNCLDSSFFKNLF